MMEYIYNHNSSFDPQEVIDYIRTKDTEGTAKARELILETEEIVFDDVLKRLKEWYGNNEKDFWMKGTPLSVRNSCDQRYNSNPDRKERWHELNFSDYSDIMQMCAQNWELFKERYNFTGVQKRSEALRWLGKLNRLRNKTLHGSKAKGSPLDRPEVKFIKRIHQLILKHVRDGEILKARHNYLASLGDGDPETIEASVTSA